MPRAASARETSDQASVTRGNLDPHPFFGTAPELDGAAALVQLKAALTESINRIAAKIHGAPYINDVKPWRLIVAVENRRYGAHGPDR